MSKPPKKAPYEVGYRKPPRQTQFQPGQSGNAAGRPKGAKNLATIVNNAITEKVAVTENGKRKSVSKLEVAVKQLVNKAASGDQRAMQQLLPLVQLIEGRNEAAAAVSASTLAEADHLVMDSINERIRQRILADIPQPTIPKEKEHE